MDKYDRYFMRVAFETAKLSYAEKKKVGCVIVKDKRICSIGFNGQPTGLPNVCEEVLPDGTLKTLPTVIHAEANALAWTSKTEVITEGATMYITYSPCINCALLMIQAGIKKVFYFEEYKNDQKSGLKLLESCGVEVIHMDSLEG